MKKSKNIHIIVLVLVMMMVMLSFVACTKSDENPPKEPSQTIYGQYITDNADGSRFNIVLREDGTFMYLETWLSSFIGEGNYAVEGNIVTLVVENIPNIHGSRTQTNKFKYEDGKLFFIEDGSDNFMYIKLQDGAEFRKANTSAD